MKDANHEIYMVADASGGTSVEARKYAMDLMVQAGAVPMTWQQVMLEWQRDWARKVTYAGVIAIVQEHSGAYGMGRRLRHNPRSQRDRAHQTRTADRARPRQDLNERPQS
jgi:hypothetical protein